MKDFAFIVHLRSIEDIAHAMPLPKWLLTKLLRRPVLSLFLKLKGRAGFKVDSSFKIEGEEGSGYIILLWMTGKQVMENPVLARRRILEAASYARNRLGVEILGLGALTASITGAGKWVETELKKRGMNDITVTHGDTYATALATEGVLKIALKKGLNIDRSSIAIVGATGIIGEAFTRFFAERFPPRELVLVGRRKGKMEEMAEQFSLQGGKVVTSTDVEAVKGSDIVITATSAPESLLSSKHLKEGAMVYEVSQPRNVSYQVKKERPDILVIDGAYAKVPDRIRFHWMGLPPGITFGCMAETIILALGEYNGKNLIGRVNLDLMEEIKREGSKRGFVIANPTSFNEPIEV